MKVGMIGASTESTPFTTMPANFVGPRDGAAGAGDRARKRRRCARTARRSSSCRAHRQRVQRHRATRRPVERATGTKSCSGDRRPAARALVDVCRRRPHARGDRAPDRRRRGDRVVLVGARVRARRRAASPARHVSGVDDLSSRRSVPARRARTTRSPSPTAIPQPYEGKPVVADAEVQKIADEAIARAGERRDEKLGVTLASTMTKAYGTRVGRRRLVQRSDARGAPRGRCRADQRRRPARRHPGRRADLRPAVRGDAVRQPVRARRCEGQAPARLVTTNLQRGGGILSWGGARREGALQGRQARGRDQVQRQAARRRRDATSSSPATSSHPAATACSAG